MSIRQLLRPLIPASVREWRWQRRKRIFARDVASLPLGEKFDAIYRGRYWGHSSDGNLSSGNGTRDYRLTEPYIAAVATLLQAFPEKPTVVDLGCGDFEIGRRVRPFAGRYIGCDVSAAIIEQDWARYAGDAGLEFHVLNAVDSPLPGGDVLTIRQVLQHLSNADILQVLPKLQAYPFVVVTEDVPEGEFTANADHQSGFSVRTIEGNSGVDLAQPPFNLRFKSSRVICEVKNTEAPGVVRTTLYEM